MASNEPETDGVYSCDEDESQIEESPESNGNQNLPAEPEEISPRSCLNGTQGQYGAVETGNIPLLQQQRNVPEPIQQEYTSEINRITANTVRQVPRDSPFNTRSPTPNTNSDLNNASISRAQTGNGQNVSNHQREGSQQRIVQAQIPKSAKRVRYDILILVLLGILNAVFIKHILDNQNERLDELEANRLNFEFQMSLELTGLQTSVSSILQELKSLRLENADTLEVLRIDILRHCNSQSPDPGNSRPYGNENHSSTLMTPKPPGIQSEKDKTANFLKSMEILRKEVQSPMPRETWMELYAGIADTMKEGSLQPARIILVVPSSLNFGFASCFAKKLARTINLSHGYPQSSVVKEISTDFWNSFLTPTDIDEDLQSYFEREGKAVLVYEPDKITKKEHLMLFHSFCDNDNAFDKSATFIFLLRVPNGFGDDTGADSATIARQILHNGWEPYLVLDTRSALIARVAGTVVSLEGGNCQL